MTSENCIHPFSSSLHIIAPSIFVFYCATNSTFSKKRRWFSPPLWNAFSSPDRNSTAHNSSPTIFLRAFWGRRKCFRTMLTSFSPLHKSSSVAYNDHSNIAIPFLIPRKWSASHDNDASSCARARARNLRKGQGTHFFSSSWHHFLLLINAQKQIQRVILGHARQTGNASQ